MAETFDAVMKKIQSRQSAGVEEIPPELRKTRKFDDILFWLCNLVYEQNMIEEKGEID